MWWGFKLISDFVWQIEDDAYQEDLGFSLGQLGKSGSGRVRQAQVNEATKARISKSLQVNARCSFILPALLDLCCLLYLCAPFYRRQRTLQKQSMTYGGKSTVRDRSSGTSSSVAFTPLQVRNVTFGEWRALSFLFSFFGSFCFPLQGLEIVNPQAAEKKVAEANQKYFSNMAEFLKVKKEWKM